MMHKHIFGITERGGIPDANMRALQKGLLNRRLLLVAAQEEVTTTKKRSETGRTKRHLQDLVLPCCGQHFEGDEERSARNVNFYSGQSNRNF